MPWKVAAPAKSTQPPRKRTFGEDALGALTTFNRNFIPFADELADAATAATRLASGESKTFGEAWKKSRDMANQASAEFTKARPNAAAFTRGTGTAASLVVPTLGGATALTQGTRAANMARGAVVAGTEGALYGLGQEGNLNQRLQSGNRNMLTSAAFGAAGGALAPSIPRKSKPIDPNVRKLAEEGVQMTPGQMRGGLAKTMEDQATSFPIMGQAIQEARTEGLKTYNRAGVNRALKPINEALPDNVETGFDAIKYAGDKLSAGYDNLSPAKPIRADPGFADDVRSVFSNLDTLTPDAQGRLQDILDKRLTSRLGKTGEMDGNLYKTIQSELNFEVNRFKGAGDPDLRAVGDAIEGVQTALEQAARRQDSSFASQMDALDRGWSELVRLENAAAKPGAEGGVFTANMYDSAVRAGDSRLRKRGFARGEALGQDLSQAGRAVLPSKVPDSGTAGRAELAAAMTIPGTIVGTLTGGPIGGAVGGAASLGGLALGAKMYSPKAINAANKALNVRLSREAQEAALQELQALAARSPEAAELYRTVLGRIARTSGAVGGQLNATPAQ